MKVNQKKLEKLRELLALLLTFSVTCMLLFASIAMLNSIEEGNLRRKDRDLLIKENALKIMFKSKCNNK